MNGVLIAVLLILSGTTVIGYWRGFIRIAFSLVSMLVLIVLVSWLTPYIAGFLKENTNIYRELAQNCTQRIQWAAEEKIEESMKGEPEKAEGTAVEGANPLQELLGGIPIPNVWSEQFMEKAKGTVNQTLEESGVYQQMGEYIADWMIRGISFFAAYIVISLALRVLVEVLDVIAKLPMLKGMNRLLGAAAGLLQGLLIVWLLMFLVAIACTSQPGQIIISDIKESVFLSFLYENNAILYFFHHMFGI